MLDPGHGDVDQEHFHPISMVFMKRILSLISLKTEVLLIERGINVMLTREDDMYSRS